MRKNVISAGNSRFFWFLLMAPAILVLILIFAYPLVYSFYLSLSRYDIIRPPEFIGLRNYIKIISDPHVWNSIKVTLVFSTGALITELVIGFGIALILNDIKKIRNLFRTIYAIPIMLTPVVVGVIWRMMTNYDFGIINYFVLLLGFDRVAWTTNALTAMPLLIIVDVWQQTGYVILILSAGLAQLPEELNEAAQIDGANFWQLLINVTIPLLRPIFIVVIIFRLTSLLRMFDKAVTLTQGGPFRSTETITFHVYNRMFHGFQVGYSAAVAFLLLGLTLLFVLPLIREM
jgi:multiple sugar transport system permease protein